MARKMMLFMGILYVSMFGSLMWMIYTEGLRQIWSFINLIVYNFIYTAVSYLLFGMTIGLSLDLTLKT